MNKNYIPLYRKYRPQSLEEIVGQEHIKKALTNAIEMDRISHAYLFTGPRGTGKTSTARIFAKSLNCEKGPTINPCNECENCKNITNSIPIDVIEIDAASNRSVNDADEIIQKVALAPVSSRYKIYIIDEVHMLTTQAFNALLKTLEEPPKNVIFILATTEAHKVLDTIKSRCQRFDFKRITTDDIAKHLRFISDNEKINITDEALLYIAQNSAGGMRDSIALLDQLSVLNSKEAISVDDINRLLGRISFNSLTSMFENILNSDKNKALDVLNDIYNQGNEPVQILSNLLEYFRNALILKSIGGNSTSDVVQLNDEQCKILNSKLQNIEVYQLVSLVDKCATYIKELKLTSNPKLWLDISIIDMANLTENTKLEDLQKRLAQLEAGNPQKLVNVSVYNTPPTPVMKPEIKQPVVKLSENADKSSKVLESKQSLPETKIKNVVPEDEVLTSPVPTSKPASSDNIKALWTKFLDNISSFPSRAILKQQAIPVKLSAEEVILTIKNPSWLSQFGAGGNKHSYIVEASNLLFNSTPKVIVREPSKGDDKIRSQQSSMPDSEVENKKTAPKKSLIVENIETEVEEAEDSIDVTNQEFDSKIASDKDQKSSVITNQDNSYHSDEVNNVMNLFEGKIIE